MATSRGMLAIQIAECADAFVACGPEDQQCFYDQFDRLVQLVERWRKLKLGDTDRVSGNIANDTTEASKAAGLRNIQRGSIRWKIVEELAQQRAFSNFQGGTVREFCTLLNRPHQTVSSAINDLMNGGWITTSSRGEREGQTIWVISQRGYDGYHERIA